MTRNRLLTIAAVILLVAIAAGLVFLRRGKGEAEAEPHPTAVITVAPVRSQAVQEVASVYGLVQADPAGSMTVAAPKAAIVSGMLVRSGETVAAGQPLVEITNAPGSDLAYKQAADAVAFAQTDLVRVQRLYDERLAASDQFSAAKKTLADAQAVLAAQDRQGAGRSQQTLRAPQAGIVTNVAAAAGDHVAQDAPLVVLARSGAEVAKLGLEPSSGRFAAGQTVLIKPSFGGPAIRSRLTMVGRAADQITKTLDAVAPLNGVALPIGSPVQGEVITGEHTGLVIPRASVVFDETGTHVFTVSGGQAHRVFVNVGLDNGETIEIKGPVLAGAQVAVEGAYELQDGMAVKVRGQ